MILRRYHIRAGATTTAGGIVRASSDWFKLNGAPLAREGDPVECPACGAQGVIKCVMPRLTDRFEGKEYALSDDLCICGCHPPPKLIADQQSKCQIVVFASEEPALAPLTGKRQPAQANGQLGKAANYASHAMDGANTADLRPLRIVDQVTGSPRANLPYRLTFTDGNVVQGTTDANGYTKPLPQHERVALR